MAETSTNNNSKPDGFLAMLANCGGRATVGVAEATAVASAAVVSFAYAGIALGEVTFDAIVNQMNDDVARKLKELHTASMERVLK